MRLVSFVIPCYRSAHTITGVVDELSTAMAEMPEYDSEFILVNDCSPDNTFEVLRDLAEKDGRITAVDLAKNFGQHAALMSGMRHAAGEIVVCLDDDGQTPGNEVGKLLKKLDEGYDVVYGAYPEIKQNGFRRFGTWMNKRMAVSLLDWPEDVQATSFFICRRLIVDEVLKYDKPYPYLDGLIIRATKNIGSVEVHQRERASGSSGYTFGKLLKLWLNGFTAFSVKPLRAASLCGGLFAVIGFLWMLVIVIVRLTDTTVVEGWTTLMAVLLLVGGLLMVMLGLIGEYIGRIYICINNSPQYVIREMRPRDLLALGKKERE